MRLLAITAYGRLDAAFGRAGRVDIRASRRGDSGIEDLATDGFGRIVAGGWADGAGRTGFAVTRLSAKRRPDASFGVLRGPSLGGRTGVARALAFDAAGESCSRVCDRSVETVRALYSPATPPPAGHDRTSHSPAMTPSPKISP